eukprot:m.225425 g.225425  ORF g.225425 m.225425 type:complete len:108 (+) comp33460_c2_seq1:166-489(+)
MILGSQVPLCFISLLKHRNTIVALIVDNALRFKHIPHRWTVLKEIQSHGGYCEVQRALSTELIVYVSMKHRVSAIESKTFKIQSSCTNEPCATNFVLTVVITTVTRT